jgi:hypothetical protein
MNPQGAMVAAMAIGLLGLSAAESGEKSERVYEMRTYWSPEGRLDDLNARFRNHTVKLFEKHGMTNVGYWVPIDNKENKLVYILSHSSREAAKKSWSAFVADPDWKAVVKATEAKGKIVAKVESVFMKATDYSPEPKPAAGERVFELRTYTASPKNLDNLNARFRNHTLKLFEKHGMTNLGYWAPVAGQKGADDTLIYLLAHKSEDAAKQSFAAFRDDPAWKSAREASEKNAGGSLTAKDGVKSVFMKATDYSPMK